MKLIVRKTNARLSVASGGEAPGVVKKAEAFLYERFHPKCANPACPAAFHWLAGGKFFRFRPEETSSNDNQSKEDSPTGHQGVKHYWLCERCSHLFTLVYEQEQG